MFGMGTRFATRRLAPLAHASNAALAAGCSSKSFGVVAVPNRHVFARGSHPSHAAAIPHHHVATAGADVFASGKSGSVSFAARAASTRNVSIVERAPTSAEANSTCRVGRSATPSGAAGCARRHSIGHARSTPVDVSRTTWAARRMTTTPSPPSSRGAEDDERPANGSRMGAEGRRARGLRSLPVDSKEGSGPSAGVCCGPTGMTATGTGDAPLHAARHANDPWNPDAPSPTR